MSEISNIYSQPEGGERVLCRPGETFEIIDNGSAVRYTNIISGSQWYGDREGNEYATYEVLLRVRRENKLNELLK